VLEDKWFVIPTAEGWVMGYQLLSGGWQFWGNGYPLAEAAISAWYMAQQEAE
jgi:hypothetical protein